MKLKSKAHSRIDAINTTIEALLIERKEGSVGFPVVIEMRRRLG